jgi:hypothetical protein
MRTNEGKKKTTKKMMMIIKEEERSHTIVIGVPETATRNKLIKLSENDEDEDDETLLLPNRILAEPSPVSHGLAPLVHTGVDSNLHAHRCSLSHRTRDELLIGFGIIPAAAALLNIEPFFSNKEFMMTMMNNEIVRSK